MKVQNKVIVVTGGASGLGKALVEELLNRGAGVAAIDINQEGLQELVTENQDFSDRLSAYVVDVTKEEDIFALPEKVISDFGQVDGIINNAGIIHPFERVNDLKLEKIRQVFEINLFGQIYMIKAFLPKLLDRPEGHITNISSMGGFFPVPGQTIYGASKAAIKLLSEGLKGELINTNVNVTVVFPGGMDTNIMKNSKIELSEEMKKLQSSTKALPATKAAEMIVNAMERNKFKINVGKDAKAMSFFYRLMPNFASRMFAKTVGSKMLKK